MIRAASQDHRWLILVVLMGVLAGGSGSASTVVRAQAGSPPPSATDTTVTLFHDDFITRANRWSLSASDDQNRVSYSEADSTLDFSLTTPHALVSSVPDTDLAPDTFALDLQTDARGSRPDARIGAILAEYSDQDFIAVTVTHGGLVQIGEYQQNNWQALATPMQTTLTNSTTLTLHVEVTAADPGTLDRQVSVTLNSIPVLTATLNGYRPGTFGIVAENGTSGASSFSVRDFRISQISKGVSP